MLCKLSDSVAAWGPVERKVEPRSSKMCAYVCQNHTLSSPWWKESIVLLIKGWYHIMEVMTKVSVNSTRSLRTRMAPQGCLNLRYKGWIFILTPPLTSCWMLAVPRKTKGFGGDGFLQLTRIPKEHLSWEPSAPNHPSSWGPGGIWPHSIHWGSFIFHDQNYVCHCFSSLEKGIGPE